jgi:acyl-CoA thioesterase
MDERLKQAIRAAVEQEPFARGMGIALSELEEGFSAVEMVYDAARHDNLYARAHGGAIFGLIDAAFETAGQTGGTIAVALNVNVTFVASPAPGTRLRAEARRVAATRRTATYDIRVAGPEGKLFAVCQALAYDTGKPIPFLNGLPARTDAGRPRRR